MVAGACSSAVPGHPAKPIRQHPGGLSDVRSAACTTDQLRQLKPNTPRTALAANTTRTGFLNTRKTAPEIKRDTLLIVTTPKRDTLFIAVSSGCWVKGASHIKAGVMTVVFLMDQAGYSVFEHEPFHPYLAAVTATETYLHVVAR